MKKVAGIVGGLALGVLCTSFGLIDTSLGRIQLAGGNEWTPIVTGGGALAGAVIGGSSFFRRHIFSFLLGGLGLLAAIVLRDEYLLQPPIVFLDLFGLPLIAVGIGSWLDGWRTRNAPTPSTVVLVGLAAVLAVVVFTLTARGLTGRGATNDCETVRGSVTHCALFRE